ncbi:MAG: NAD-dependent deacylase [Deltaproteobacteria bacterium]|jgi:NAD-dependent deacetylase|nr:NAD-dependent deacylase [Deltaproteobacteria bacterium]
MIIILTGAGISQESGIATFRDKNGLWNKVKIEDVATPQAFKKNPKLVHQFYNQRRRELISGTIKPNPAHLALVQLESALKTVAGKTDQGSHKGLFLVTQNVDNLHEAAGSQQVCHMHGRLCAALCQSCQARFDWTTDLSQEDVCPKCQTKGSLRPDVVWFNEIPYFLDEIQEKLKKCTTFVAIGTSGVVYPAAAFFGQAKSYGAQTIEINLEPSQSATSFNRAFYGPASKTVPAWVSEVLADLGK